MRSNGGNPSSLPTLGAAYFAVLCLGFGCFFAVCPFSALGTAAMLRDAMGWQEILVARAAFLVFSAAFFAARGAKGPGWCLPGFVRSRLGSPVGEALVGALGAMASFTLLAFGYPLLSGGALAVLSGCLLGFAMATLGGAWFGAFFAVRRERGRTACVVAFACSFLATVLLTWASNLLGVGRGAALAAVFALLAASWGLYGLAARRGSRHRRGALWPHAALGGDGHRVPLGVHAGPGGPGPYLGGRAVHHGVLGAAHGVLCIRHGGVP